MLTELSRLQTGRRRSHKGPRATTSSTGQADAKPKKKTQLAARRDELMGEQSVTEPARVVQRSKDMRTQQQKNELLAWVIVPLLLLFSFAD